MSIYFKVFLVSRNLFGNRKPYLFGFTSLRVICLFISAPCPRFTDKNQWSFRAHSKKQFPLGLYSRLKKVRMHEELQKKLDCDERIKEIKSQLEEKSVELKELQVELHRTEERIHQRK